MPWPDARLEGLLAWHLGHNHHPGVPVAYYPFARKAIEMQGSDEVVKLDDGRVLTDKTGAMVTSRQTCDGWHLWDFVRLVQEADDMLAQLDPRDISELRDVAKEITGDG